MPRSIDAPQPQLDSDPAPNILQLCLSKSWGGLEMYPAHIGAALVRHGCLVHGAALEGTSVADSFTKAGLPHLTFGSQVHALLAVKKTLDYIRRHHITVIHAHKSGDMRLASLLVHFAPHLKLFFTDHMGVAMSKKDWLHRWMYRKATRLFSISRVTHARNLNAFPLPPERITQFYYGIDFRPYKPPSSLEQRQDVRRALKVPVNGLLLGIPGRINRGKGQMQWVQALSVLAMKPLTVDWHAVIIGEASGEDALEGGYKAQLVERIAALGLSSRVTLAGFQSQMAQCLQAIDIAAIPSHNEAFGFSVIEAMAAGCAVIGSNSGAIPELISADVGLLVNPDDSQAFANALATLMQNDELRHGFGQRARNFALGNFDMDAHIVRLLEYYRA